MAGGIDLAANPNWPLAAGYGPSGPAGLDPNAVDPFSLPRRGLPVAGQGLAPTEVDDPTLGGVSPPPPPTIMAPQPPAPIFPVALGTSGGSSSSSVTMAPKQMPGYMTRGLRFSEQEAQLQKDLAYQKGLAASEAEWSMSRSRETKQREMAQSDAAIAKHQVAVAKHQEKMAKLDEELAKKVVDPERYWKQGGAARRIGAFFAQALVAVGQGLQAKGGMRPGPSPVMQAIDRDIQRDIAAQEQDLATLQRNRAGAQNMLAMMRDQTNDLGVAKLRLEQRLERDAADVLRGIAMKSQSPIAQIEGQRAALQLLQKANDKAEMIFEASQNKVTKSTSGHSSTTKYGYAMQDPQSGVVSMTTPQQAARMAAQGWRPVDQAATQQRAKARLEGEKPKQKPPDKVLAGVAATAEAQREMQFYLRDWAKLGLKDLAMIKAGGKLASGTLASQVVSRHGAIVAAMRRAKESGVMTDRDFDRYVGMMPDLTTAALNKTGGLRQFKLLFDQMDAKNRDTLDLYGSKYDMSDLAQFIESRQGKSERKERYRPSGGIGNLEGR